MAVGLFSPGAARTAGCWPTLPNSPDCALFGSSRLRRRQDLRRAVVAKPAPRGVLAREVEVLHLGVDEMACDVRHDGRESAIGDDSNLADALMMVLDELGLKTDPMGLDVLADLE